MFLYTSCSLFSSAVNHVLVITVVAVAYKLMMIMMMMMMMSMTMIFSIRTAFTD